MAGCRIIPGPVFMDAAEANSAVFSAARLLARYSRFSVASLSRCHMRNVLLCAVVVLCGAEIAFAQPIRPIRLRIESG